MSFHASLAMAQNRSYYKLDKKNGVRYHHDFGVRNLNNHDFKGY